MRISYRDAIGDAFVKAGERFPNLALVTADVSKSTRSILFKEKYPDRFFSVGIAEADAVGIAAGISTFGGPVIFTAYAVFATEKPFEQIRNMLCYPNLNVKVVATHGGINVGEDGVTHQAIEDIAIMRAIPNMKVLVAADPGEVEAALMTAIQTSGPVYLRLGRATTEVLYEKDTPYQLGKGEILAPGKDVSLLAVGMMVYESLKARDMLAQEGIDAEVVNLRCVKPIDAALIVDSASRTGAVVVAEDHNRYGGAGGAVAEVLSLQQPTPLEQVALNDTFAESGECTALLKKYGLTADAIVAQAKKAIQRKQKRGGMDHA